MNTSRIAKKLTAALSALVIGIWITPVVPDRTADAAANTTIYNDTFWKDTSGNYIYSQGGGIFKFGDTYYWYGVH